jgi:hypothetical protein
MYVHMQLQYNMLMVLSHYRHNREKDVLQVKQHWFLSMFCYTRIEYGVNGSIGYV